MKKLLSVMLAAVLLLPLAIGVFVPAAAEEIKDATDLYVKDGLVGVFDAFGDTASNTNVDLNTGKWTAGDKTLTLSGLWTAGADGRGIRYEYTDIDNYNNNTGIAFSPALLGEGDYTVEAVLIPHGVLDEETGERYVAPIEEVAPGVDNALQFGALHAYLNPAVCGATTSLAYRYYYSMTQNFAAVGDDYIAWNNGFYTVGKDEPTGWSLTHTVVKEDDRDTSHFAFRDDRNITTAFTVPADEYLTVGQMNRSIRLFYSLPCTVYGVRIYNRALTEDERAQNRFADLCGYYGLPFDVILPLLSQQEKTEMFRALYAVDFSAGAQEIGTVISGFLTGDVTDGTVRALTEKYRLNLLSYFTHTDAKYTELASLPATAPVSTVQHLLDTCAAGGHAIREAVTFAGYRADSEENPDLTAVFSVDPALIATLENMGYKVSVGAMVGLDEYYPTFDDMTSLFSEKSAPIATYTAYTTGDKAIDEFTMTVRYDEAVQTRTGYKTAVRFLGFLSTERESGNRASVYIRPESEPIGKVDMFDAAKYFVCEYDGEPATVYALNANKVLRGVLKTCNYAGVVTKAPSEDEVLLATLKADLAAGLEEALKVSEVRICGQEYADHTIPAIWIQYMDTSSEKFAVKPSDSRIRPIFLYFPSNADPSTVSDRDKATMGMKRVFGYIGFPSTYGENTPGIVCVHGGGGHAYVRYVQEALNHGFAAIAIDTDGCYSKIGDGGETNYTKDPTLSFLKDALSTSREPIEEQWMYFVQRALIYANTALRSFDSVTEEEVGITGISWGGLATTIALTYDDRYAFGVPVYLSANMDESEALGVSGLVSGAKNDPFMTALWQDDERLRATETPILVLNGDEDPYASLNTSLLTTNMLQNAEMCIRHSYGHSQERGASAAEIYAWAKYALGYTTSAYPMFAEKATVASGRHYSLAIADNHNLSDYSAKIWYSVEPTIYNAIDTYADKRPRTKWQSAPLTVTGDTVLVEVPEEACMYYVELCAYNAKEDAVPTVYYEYDGYLYGSTDLIPIGCERLYDGK